MSARTGRTSLAARVAAVLALLLAAVCGGLTAGATPAAAAALPMAKCTTTSGVVLAVDFSHWGGPLLRSCGTTPTTGYTLLNQGGWQTTGTQHDGPAFVCRIGYAGYQGGTQYPTSKNEACVLTPPATAYWSYWHADPGQNTWSYSQLGAMSYHPKPGGVELWIFGATNIAGTQGRPAFSPDAVRAHNTAPGGTASSGGTTSSGSSGSSGGTTSSGGTSSGGGGGSTPAPTHRPTTGAASTAPPSAPPSTLPATTAPPAPSPDAAATLSTAPAPGAATVGTPSPSAPRTQDAEPTAAVGHDSGSVLPAAITAAALAVIAVLIVLRVRRRGRAE